MKNILENVLTTRKELEKNPDLTFIGPNKYHLISIQCKPFSTHVLGDELTKIGKWYVGNLQLPHAIHLCVTDANVVKLDQFVKDIKKAITNIKEDPTKFKSKLGSLYGATTRMTDKRVLSIIINDFLDC